MFKNVKYKIIQIEKESQFTLLMNVDAVVDERDNNVFLENTFSFY